MGVGQGEEAVDREGEETEEEEMEGTRVAFVAPPPPPPPEVLYPAPLLSHEELCRNPLAFMDILRRFHYSLGTRFMIPVIGGKDLDLHLLYEQVTQRGGLEKVILERRWREVIAAFNFPPTTTSASFVLRKYYLSLLHHFEQVYFFRVQGPLIAPAAALQTKTYTNSVSDSIMTSFRKRKRTLQESQSEVVKPLCSIVHGNGFVAPGSTPLPCPLVESRPKTVAQDFLTAVGGIGSVTSGSIPLASATSVPPTPEAGAQSLPSTVHGSGFVSSGSAPLPHPLVESKSATVTQHFPPTAVDNVSIASDSIPTSPAVGVHLTPSIVETHLPYAVHGNGFVSLGSAPLPYPSVECRSATVAQNFSHIVGGNGSAAYSSFPPAPAIGVPLAPAVVAQPLPNAIHGNGFVSSASAPLPRPHVEIRPATVGGNGLAASSSIPPPATGIPTAPATGPYDFTVTGTIDGKFEHGYFVTVKISSQILRGVLYHAAQAPAAPSSAATLAAPSNVIVPCAAPSARVHRRRRRLRYRDPAHPKPNRSAYNFFFAEKHSKLKALYPQREREFSKMIGESWNKLNEEEREVYHAFGRRDKDRYRREMQEYRERLKLAPLREARPMEAMRAEPPILQVDADAFRVI